jgi:hypothetical protein
MDDSLLLHFVTIVTEVTERSLTDGEDDSTFPSLTTVDSPPALSTLCQPVQNTIAISHSVLRVKHCSYGHNVALLAIFAKHAWHYGNFPKVHSNKKIWSPDSHVYTHTIVKTLQLHFCMKTNEDVTLALVIWNYCC